MFTSMKTRLMGQLGTSVEISHGVKEFVRNDFGRKPAAITGWRLLRLLLLLLLPTATSAVAPVVTPGG